MKTIIANRYGGPEVLQIKNILLLEQAPLCGKGNLILGDYFWD